MKDRGQAVKIPAQRVGQRLGFVVIVKAGEVTPARSVAQLDKAGAKLGTKEHPAQNQNWQDWRLGMRRTEERSEEARLQQHGLPAEAEEALADIHDREIEHPQQKPCANRNPHWAGFCEAAEGA